MFKKIHRFQKLRSEILGLYLNTLTAGDKNFCYYRENFEQRIQKQLSKKPKVCPPSFIIFLKSAYFFKDFETKNESYILNNTVR